MRFSHRFIGTLLALMLILPWSMGTAAQGASIPFNVLLLIDESYFVDEGTYCRIDVDNQSKILLKVNNQEGKRRGGEWFYKGEIVESSNGASGTETYCAYSKTVVAEERGEVDLFLHGVFLTTINPLSIPGDQLLQLIVGVDGPISVTTIERRDAQRLGIELPDELESQSISSDSESGEQVVRRPRPGISDGDQPSEVTRTERTSTSSSRRNTTETREKSGIVTGEWDLQGDSAFDLVYVEIIEDYNGSGPEIMEGLDPLEMAVEVGMPLIGEGSAPEGCRIFAYSGPLGVAMYIGFCANGENTLYAATTDKDVLDDILFDFSQDLPFEIPHGYHPSL